jgi:hypothetical protein
MRFHANAKTGINAIRTNVISHPRINEKIIPEVSMEIK